MQGSDFWQPCAPPKSCRNQKSFWDPSTYHPNTTGLGWFFFISKKHVLVGHPSVHLEEHLKGEKDDEEKVCGLLELAEPVRLPKVLSCQYLTIIIKCAKKNPNHGVEKDKSDDHPKHCLWLHCTPAFGLHTPEGEGNCSFSSVCWPQSTSAPRYPTQPQC